MSKKILVMVLVLMLFSYKEVSATHLSDFFPGGKNYLDIDNIIIDGNSLSTDDPILVKPNTEYTLTFPGTDLLGESMFINLSGETDYLFGDPSEINDCLVSVEVTICNFTTTIGESYLSFDLSGTMFSLYYSYYGIDYFQLEEGNVSTEYEEYIPPFGDTTSPEFAGVGAYITSYQTIKTLQSIIDDHVVAIDDIDGNISDSVVVEIDPYTTNEQIVGDYDVLLSVKDSSDNVAYLTLTIMVKDEVLPTITGPLSIDQPVGSTALLLGIIEDNYVLYDEYDVSLFPEVVEDNYTDNRGVIGSYSASFMITDDSMNSVSRSFTINVVDTIAPVMIGSSIINSYLSSPLYLSDVLENVTFTDNYDDTMDINVDVSWDDYSGEELNPGTYSIYLLIEDLSGNALVETLTVNVIDDVAPTIVCLHNYSTSYTEELTLDDIKNKCYISDNVDTLASTDMYVISDSYTNRTTDIGSYAVVLGVQDSNGNEAIHEIIIHYYDDVAPVIYVDNYIITVDLSSTFSENDALKLLLGSNELENKDYTIVKLIDEYSGNEDNPGSYVYRLAFTDDEGITVEKEFLVKVADSSIIKLDNSLLPRNIAIYSSILGFTIFVIIKKRKIVI